MLKNKKDILKSLTPKAVLMPLTKEAAQTTHKSQCFNGIIQILKFPFKIGRESRIGENSMGKFLKFRLKKEDTPNNDIYLVDIANNNLQISKEHFEIIKSNNFYLLKDRGSSTGTTINDITYKDEDQVLNDGDIIKIGSSESLYKFRFVVLDE